MSGADVEALRAARPDLVLLVGGTDGGNAEVLLHNASRLATARITVPRRRRRQRRTRGPRSSAALAATGRSFTVGRQRPAGHRRHRPRVGPGRDPPGLPRARDRRQGALAGPDFAAMVQAPTPDAVLDGVAVLAEQLDGDVLVVDIGGATTDVYSALRPQGEDAGLAKDVVAPLWHVAHRRGRPRHAVERRGDRRGRPARAAAPARTALEAYAARVVRRHRSPPGRRAVSGPSTSRWPGRPRSSPSAATRGRRRPGPARAPWPTWRSLVGSGGVLRHADPASRRDDVLRAVATDHAGGWKVPRDAALVTDAAYLLFAVGLLRAAHPEAAARPGPHRSVR